MISRRQNAIQKENKESTQAENLPQQLMRIGGVGVTVYPSDCTAANNEETNQQAKAKEARAGKESDGNGAGAGADGTAGLVVIVPGNGWLSGRGGRC